MRLSIIYLVSLLLVPSLVASKQYEPPPVSPHPSHGHVVRFQGPYGGHHLGIVVGSHQQQGGNVNVAPLAPHSRLPPHPVIALNDHLVNTHPGNVASTGFSAHDLASSLQEYHRDHAPNLLSASGAVEGSPNRPLSPRGYGGTAGVRGHR